MLLLNDSWKLWTQNGIVNKTTAVNVLVWKGFQGEKGKKTHHHLQLNYLEIQLHTLHVTTHLSRLTVYIDLWQAGRLFGRSEGLKLTEVGKIGLLGNLLGGGGGEYCSASWSPLCLCTMPSEWYWCLERERGDDAVRPHVSLHGSVWHIVAAVKSLFCLSHLCGQRSRWHSRRVSYRRGLRLSWCSCGGEGAVHVERRGARVRGVGPGRWRRGGHHLQSLWRRTRLRPEQQTIRLT